ncbi:bestrophin family protein [Rhizorhabdus sp.]|jgi:ion channel-forming bestrophin family protein|uniref:bestrophin family protein n=1 Tax=Rhizorhabdus sp. TaxID=1968843 RepID=UPI0035B13E30
MIVGTRPRFRQIIIEIWKPLTILFAWDVIVTSIHFQTSLKEPALPLALFGTALGLFLGFRTNAAYGRWWEARTLWGALINSSRSLARITKSFVGDKAVVEAIVRRQIAFAHAMRCRLRAQSARGDIARIVDEPFADSVAARTNIPNAITEDISRIVSEAHQGGAIRDVQQAVIERTLTDIANAQGGMERIKSTPLPNGFQFLPNFFTRLFCILLPIGIVESLGWFTPIGSTLIGMIFLAALRIGDDLTDPFANSVHDVPLSAMCTTIEIDLLEMIGSPPPPPAAPCHGTLW